MKNTKYFIVQGVIGSAAILSSFYSFNIDFGLQSVRFSPFNVLMPPLVSFFFSLPLLAVLCSTSLYLRSVGMLFIPRLGLATLAAMAVWQVHNSKKNQFMKQFVLYCLVPLFCMALFNSHPVGRLAYLYSLYWLIPASLFFLQRLLPQSLQLFSIALTSTFLAHALGSVLYIYMYPTTSAFWLALLPVVAFERLLFAGAMAGSFVFMRRVVTDKEKVGV